MMAEQMTAGGVQGPGRAPDILIATWSREHIYDADAGQWVPWREWIAAAKQGV